MLLLGSKGVCLADVVKDFVNTVHIVVDDDDVLTVLIHSYILIMDYI